MAGKTGRAGATIMTVTTVGAMSVSTATGGIAMTATGGIAMTTSIAVATAMTGIPGRMAIQERMDIPGPTVAMATRAAGTVIRVAATAGTGFPKGGKKAPGGGPGTTVGTKDGHLRAA